MDRGVLFGVWGREGGRRLGAVVGYFECMGKTNVYDMAFRVTSFR